MIPAEIIRKKRDGGKLSKEEILFFVRAVVAGHISHAQAAAFLMAVFLRDMDAEETATLTFAMRDSGTVFNFRTTGKPVVDKHSTGGVGDKLSLLIAPLAAECGLAVPMISGRGLGHTGGTVDKLESIPGFNMKYNEASFNELLAKNSFFMSSQTEDIAPADRILYHLRDVTATVESNALIAASIMSKKLAEDLDALVIDMKFGNGAFMSRIEDAQRLASTMLGIGRELNLKMRVLFTSMEQPLGRAVGNWLEIVESEESLRGNAPQDIRELTERLTAAMLTAGGVAKDTESALGMVRQAWDSGAALKKFYSMISEQGGSLEAARKEYEGTPSAAIKSTCEGYITAFDTRAIGLAGIILGAGRMKQDDVIDYSAGFIFDKKIGDYVRPGDTIATMYGRREEAFRACSEKVLEAITIGSEQNTALAPLVLDEWES